MDSVSAVEMHADWLSGWALTHDYDPTWDYAVRFDQRHHPLLAVAQFVLDAVSDHPQTPWTVGRVYPADLVDVDGDPVALFVHGTEGAPVVVIDLDRHLSVGADAEWAVVDSVLHELRHAWQAAYGMEYCELQAELGSELIPF